MVKNNQLAINGGKAIREKIIPLHVPFLGDDDYQMVLNALKSQFVSGDGPECKIFEKNLADYLGAKYVFFTTSATAALDLAFMIKDFPQGSEVIVPDFTFTSTAMAPILNGLKVVLVDVDSDNGNIDTKKIESKITKKTVAIVPIDYTGNPADMNEINYFAKKYNLYVVHDTAQSIGSEYYGKKTGTLADVSTFSFHGTKNLVVGEGGALVTNNDELADKIRVRRDIGTNKSSLSMTAMGFYEYFTKGNSYVQSNLLGALGISQLNKIDRIIKRRTEIANYYIKELVNYSFIKLPKITKGAVTNWHIFYLLIPPQQRDWFIEALRAEGIMANVHYHPLHLNQFYKKECIFESGDFPNAMKFYQSIVRIPIYPSLSDSETEDVISAVKKILNHFKL